MELNLVLNFGPYKRVNLIFTFDNCRTKILVNISSSAVAAHGF